MVSQGAQLLFGYAAVIIAGVVVSVPLKRSLWPTHDAQSTPNSNAPKS